MSKHQSLNQLRKAVFSPILRIMRHWYEQLSEFRLKRKSFKSFIPLFAVSMSLSIMLAAGATNSSNHFPATNFSSSTSLIAQQKSIELNLVSFSVTRAAHEKIIPKFVEQWKKERNQNVTFRQSYGASSPQALAVIEGGLEADVVHLSLAPDVQKIERAGLIQPGWEKEFSNGSIVSKSVVAIVTRNGNPKNIKTWEDLAKNGVSVITPNPITSGSARWNFLALWNAAVKTGGNESKALEFVTNVYKNVPLLPESAREATDTFFKGSQGDALITYENEVILKALNGEKLPYFVPNVNFSIDNPVAIVDRNVDKHGTREVAKAFIQYLYSSEAQQVFAQTGYRPIDPGVAQAKEFTSKYPQIKTLASANDYGGWAAIQNKFFSDNAIFAKVLRTVNTQVKKG